MLDKNRMRRHHLEVTCVLGRFFMEHFHDAAREVLQLVENRVRR